MTHHGSDDMAQDISNDSFDPDWNATDIANLQPGHLARSKPVRGWERKPASPFTKQRLRVGKVWRRALPAGRAALSNATAHPEEPTTKRLRAGQGTQSPVKIVKRLCLGANAGVGLQWDKIGSPTKRIVTRSTAADDLIALPDEDEEDVVSDFGEEDIEGTVVEILDEDGKVLQLDANHAQDDEDWSDEDAPDDNPDEQFDDTMMHLGETTAHETQTQAPAAVKEICDNDSETTTPAGQVLEAQSENPQNLHNIVEIASKTEKLLDPPALQMETTALPEGFVSPVRRRRPAGRRLSTQAAGMDRRRTLPRTFAPNMSVDTPAQPVQEHVQILEEHEGLGRDDDNIAATTEQPTEAEEQHGLEDQSAEVLSIAKSSSADDDAWEDLPEENEEGSSTSTAVLEDASSVDKGVVQEPPAAAAQSPSQQLELPLRRSPRRKSSSPFKQRSFQTFVDAAPHLVAFSPIKGRTYHNNSDVQQDEDETMHESFDGSPLMLERSVSAPPEEPQMPPRRSAKPRVSDDTALLQAFLNRAAESKSTRRMSATKRESLSNRRDSDTVRQALASPAKPEILGNLDPNSPSPKKSAVVCEDQKVAQDENILISSPDQGSEGAENTQERTTRRSHRDKRRVERAAPLAHTRISLRGNTDPVVLKRSEAQELATTTRANTRKNKGGSIMPTLRLTKLIVEKPPIEASPGVEAEDAYTKPARPGRRTVQWDETLAYFQEAPSEPEVQLFELGDSNTAPKLQGQPPVIASEPDSDEAVPAPPPAAETPSKPKVRKLRAPRTASSTSRAAAAPALFEEPAAPTPATLKQKQPRRSKLATPAKGQDAASLLPADVSAAPVADTATSASRPKAVPRKKAASRLPAPAPIPASTNESASLIASPPKKKSSAGGLSTKGPAPKLDFQTKLSASSKPADQAPEAPPGLMSPAKRAGRNVQFGSVPPGPVFGVKPGDAEERKAPGLSSPAKKRTRRAV